MPHKIARPRVGSCRVRTSTWMRAGVVLGVLLPGCAEDETTNPYAPGESGYAPPVDEAGDGEGSPPDLPPDDDTGTTGDGWEGGDEDTGDAGDTTGGSTGGTTDATTGDTSTGTTGDSTGGGACAQPGAGMFAHCLDAPACGGLSCFQIKQDDVVTDGFCTSLCANANECGPAPGDCSATPACVPVGGQTACALSCAGGAGCPSGMQCMNLQDAGEVCV